MIEKGLKDIPASELRKRAEELVRDEAALSPEEIRRMLQELQVHKTELEMQNEALRGREERYSLVLYAVNDGLWDWDVPSGNAFFSPQYYSLLEYGDREFPATYAAWRVLVHPEDLDRVEEDLRLSVENSRGFSLDFRMKLKSGRWGWFLARGRVVEQDAGGKAIRMVGTLSDITEQRLAEQELANYRNRLEDIVAERTKELAITNEKLRMEVLGHEQTADALQLSEGRFRQLSQQFNILLDAIPDRLVLMSSDLKVIWANKSARLALISAEAQHAEYCYVLWHNQDRPCDHCPILKSFQSGSPEEGEISTSDGRVWEVHSYPIKNEQGEVESVMELSSDITEKRKIQAEQMRASHLASIGELAAGVAHEINNPINGIINYAQIIANSAGPEDSEYEIAKRIIKEGERISFITTSLLSFARERKEEKLPISVQQVLADALALTEAQLKKSGIDLRLNLAQNIPLIKIHAQQIQQVFLNIINNARYALSQKYPQSDPDKVLLITAGETVIDGEPYVQVVFEDHGIGIASSHIDKVMTPFYSTKPVGVGTGLGLSISHGIIVNHKGRLSVESREGEYTRIIVTLATHKESA
jgi:PAS domain S-box-containing protein